MVWNSLEERDLVEGKPDNVSHDGVQTTTRPVQQPSYYGVEPISPSEDSVDQLGGQTPVFRAKLLLFESIGKDVFGKAA
jgi:hypothetical protein